MVYDTDLLIVGGGPGGLATALHARRQGLSVIVAEPRERPIDKACGEGLMPGVLAALTSLGVHPAGLGVPAGRGDRSGAGRQRPLAGPLPASAVRWPGRGYPQAAGGVRGSRAAAGRGC